MLHILKHPLITHKLTNMRKVSTGTKDFKQNLDEIAGLMAYEISKESILKHRFNQWLHKNWIVKSF